MTVVKKTVAIHPIMDKYIRDMWSMLIKAGYDATYSTALNFMLLESICSVAEHGTEKDVSTELNLFLADETTINELNLQEYVNKVEEFLPKKSTIAERGKRSNN